MRDSRFLKTLNRDCLKDKKTPNTIRNEQQKLKSRVAAKNRRKNESENIESLTRLVPCIPENPPDKSTTIRLSTSYIALMKVLNGSRCRNMIGRYNPPPPLHDWFWNVSRELHVAIKYWRKTMPQLN